VHGGLPDDATALAGAKDTATLEQQFQDILLRSKSQRLAAAAAFPYSPTGSLPGSPSAATKCLSLLLQQQQNENQRSAMHVQGASSQTVDTPLSVVLTISPVLAGRQLQRPPRR